MKKILTAFAIVTLFASCQKEVSIDQSTNNGGTGGGSGTGSGNGSGLLVKTVAVTGSETQTTLYTYDSQKRLETMTITGVAGGMPVNSYHKFIRDNAGRIVKVLQKIETMPGVSVDTAVKTFHYPDATTFNYDYTVHVMTMDMGGISIGTIDSAVYHYSGNKMTSYDQYMFSTMMPGMVMANSKYDFTYDATDRVTVMKMYSDAANPGGTMDLEMEWKYTYSSASINNVYISANGAQNFALNGLPNTTNHFISKMEAKSDAANMLPLEKLDGILERLIRIRKAIL